MNIDTSEYEHVLIVEDDHSACILLKNLLKGAGYQVSIAKNGQEGLELWQKYKMPVVLSDINMPGMNGLDLVDKLSAEDNNPYIILLSAVSDHKTIVKSMQKGSVVDYLVKPINLDETLFRVKSTFEKVQLKAIQHHLETERIIKLEEQIRWANFLKSVQMRDIRKNDSIYEDLYTSFNQGLGFGNVLTMLQMLIQKSEVEGDEIVIRLSKSFKALFDLNIQYIDKVLKYFGDLSRINEVKNLEIVPVQTVYECMQSVVLKNTEDALRKEHTVVLGDLDQETALAGKKVRANMEILSKVFEEILVNAEKFSEPKSNIYFFTRMHGLNLLISCISYPRTINKQKGIPDGYENLIFEPFYRIDKHVYEDYNSLDFGLGLTMVELGIRKHNGTIHIFNAQDHSADSQSNQIVNVEILIPFADEMFAEISS